MKAMLAILVLSAAGCLTSAAPQQPGEKATVDAEGGVWLPSAHVPYSDLASPEAKKNFIDFIRANERFQREFRKARDIHERRRLVKELLLIPGLQRLRKTFAVRIEPQVIAGVQTDIVEPEEGIGPGNQKRVLINLHGGSMMYGARYGGQMESVPIASLGAIRVITVDYRMAPERHFPAASEDVAKVYRALLASYPPQNIGIYGCSAGAALTGQSIAWFQAHSLPRPGAIGVFGSGAGQTDLWGDSNYIASPLMGTSLPAVPPGYRLGPSDYMTQTDYSADHPLVNPLAHSAVMKAFPPTLLLSGTRDIGLSQVLHTHARLVDLGVEADLHVWDGAFHCSFAQGTVDPNVPETREAWKVIVTFFEKHLGR